MSSFVSDDVSNKFKLFSKLEYIQSSFPFIVAIGKNFNKFISLESHNEVIEFSKKYGQHNCIAEVSQRFDKVNPFFDFDGKTNILNEEQKKNAVNDFKNLLQQTFPQLKIQFFIKDSSNDQMTSIHIIGHLSCDECSIYFRNREQVSQLFKYLKLEKPFDTQVYNGYNLRLLHSDKINKNGQLCDRVFNQSPFSDIDDKLYSLCTYCSNNEYLYIDEYVQKQFMLSFVKDNGFAKKYSLSDIVKREQDNHLSMQLTEQKCHNR